MNPLKTLPIYEVRLARAVRIPRHLGHVLSGPINTAIEASNQSRRTHPIEGSAFEVFADLRCADDGNSCFFIVAGTHLGAGKIQPGVTLFSGLVSSRRSTSVTGWRWLLQLYLATMMASNHGATFSSFGSLPRDLPFTAGFSQPETSVLTPGEHDQMQTVIRLTALRLCEHCERASSAAELAGKDFTPDPDGYPELR